MADTTWSVRVDEETKQEVIDLLNSSGDQGKEFLINLMTAYKLKKAEEMQPLASQDLKELQIHINRIQDIYYNLSQRVETKLQEKEQEVKETVNEKNASLDAALIKINELQDELLKIKDELNSSSQIAEEQSKKVLEIEDANSTIKALVAEYKEKNDTLTGLLAEYKGFKSEIENIKKELYQEMDARARAEKVSAEALESIDRLKDLHKDELKKEKDTLSLEYKQAFLDVQVKHQEELSVLHNTYNSKIEELNSKIQELLLSFKIQKAEPNTTTTKNKKSND